jgi:hypothetical protein
LSQATYSIFTTRNINKAQFLWINPVVVFTFTRQRWSSTTYSSHLACWCEYQIYSIGYNDFNKILMVA